MEIPWYYWFLSGWRTLCLHLVWLPAKKLQQDTKLLWYLCSHPEFRTQKDAWKPVQFSCLDSNYFCLVCRILCTYFHVVFIPSTIYRILFLFPVALSCCLELSSSNLQSLLTTFSQIEPLGYKVYGSVICFSSAAVFLHIFSCIFLEIYFLCVINPCKSPKVWWWHK